MKIAVVIGHEENSPGAVNEKTDVSEFEFFRKVAHDIEHNFTDYNMVDEISVVYRETNYQELPGQLNELGLDLIVSLHANAFNTEVEGCETLYYHKSVKSKKIAQIFQDKLWVLLANKNRGILPRTSEDRGGYLLRYTKAPCVLCEPFFIDNDADYLFAEKMFHDGELTRVYCEAINEAIEYLRGI